MLQYKDEKKIEFEACQQLSDVYAMFTWHVTPKENLLPLTFSDEHKEKADLEKLFTGNVFLCTKYSNKNWPRDLQQIQTRSGRSIQGEVR